MTFELPWESLVPLAGLLAFVALWLGALLIGVFLACSIFTAVFVVLRAFVDVFTVELEKSREKAGE